MLGGIYSHANYIVAIWRVSEKLKFLSSLPNAKPLIILLQVCMYSVSIWSDWFWQNPHYDRATSAGNKTWYQSNLSAHTCRIEYIRIASWENLQYVLLLVYQEFHSKHFRPTQDCMVRIFNVNKNDIAGFFWSVFIDRLPSFLNISQTVTQLHLKLNLLLLYICNYMAYLICLTASVQCFCTLLKSWQY